MKITAVCIFGVESVLAREIRNLGYDVSATENGRVSLEGDMEAVAACNLWLRTAERIYIEADSFNAVDFDQLYDRTRLIPWQRIIRKDGVFPVRAASLDSKLSSVPDCQSIVKKAIADALGDYHGISWLPETGPEFPVDVLIRNDKVTISLDTTGTALYKRGYRKLNVEAPLRETIAAALLKISYWRPGRILMDPFCGSGTFPIEAAMMSAGIPPGLNREFLFEKWDSGYASMSWEMKEKARGNIKVSREKKIFGSDISRENIRIAKKHAEMAGVGEMIDFSVCDAADVKVPGEYGVLVCNPPYGQRLSDNGSVAGIHKMLGEKFSGLETWSKYVLTDSDEFEKTTGIKADRRRKIYNGPIRCTFYQYYGPKPI